MSVRSCVFSKFLQYILIESPTCHMHCRLCVQKNLQLWLLWVKISKTEQVCHGSFGAEHSNQNNDNLPNIHFNIVLQHNAAKTFEYIGQFRMLGLLVFIFTWSMLTSRSMPCFHFEQLIFKAGNFQSHWVKIWQYWILKLSPWPWLLHVVPV